MTTAVIPKPSVEVMTLTERVAGPPIVELLFDGYAPESSTVLPCRVEILLEFNRASLQYEVCTLQFHRRPGGPEVRGEQIRRVPIADLIADALARRVLLRIDRHAEYGTFRLDAAAKGSERLRHIAVLYEWAHVITCPPRTLICEAYGAKRPTVSCWIRQARENGLIAFDEKGQPWKNPLS